MSKLLEKARAGEPLGIDIIDMHGHYSPPQFCVPELSAESLIDSMDRMGVSKLFCSTMYTHTANANAGNQLLLEAVKKFPDRISGYVSAFPASCESVKKEIEKYLGLGFSAIKLHDSNGIPYSDSAYNAAYEIAHELHMVILFHTWGGENQLNPLKDISKRYPNAILLAAHAGAANENGYIELAKECKNVYLELAYSGSPRGLVKRFVNAVGAEKIIWGSDCYYFGETHQLGKVVGARISDAEKTLILSGNAKRLLAKSKLRSQMP